MVRGTLCPATVGAGRIRRRMEGCGRVAARFACADARSTALAQGYRRRCRCSRAVDRRRRGRQLEPVPAVSLSDAVRRRRSALQQGHRLLSVFATHLHPHQELDDADARCGRAVRRSGLLATRRYRIRRSPSISVADRDRPWFSIARSVLRGEGLVLCSRSLSVALCRQRRRRRRELHRYTCGDTRSVAPVRVFNYCGVRRVGESLGAYLLASCRRVLARRHRLFRAVRCSPCAVPAVFRQTK